MYILPLSDMLHAAHVCEGSLPDDGHDGWPKHVGVKKNYCALVGSKDL
jgi:hypothetical protein